MSVEKYLLDCFLQMADSFFIVVIILLTWIELFLIFAAKKIQNWTQYEV